ncbi:OmpA family protein [Erythrobacter sp. SCSIO 43205]|uniref:OmpA family protein n=1 Tax=Erythrobacter sp. SCSIO 43205 TaxID=2779361 RepID=UPI001CA887AB|nr:OmpA family protein [Erythrobacter sp. SCSIO 43205]UAB78359.1 OmpA family protein [Erythrobacter sp. SCSIO 43205]
MRPINALAPICLLLLSACQTESEEPAPPQEPVAQPTEAVSILRPDVAVPDEVIASSKGYSTTIGFPDGGSELDADAIAALEEVAASEQFANDTPIILRAHSDSAGSDAVNARASEARGLAVAEWLINAGAKADRIDVIVFGEQNPAEPNALPDGAPNKAGRAANRRVEIEILPLTTQGDEAESAPEPSPSEPGNQS